jgi:hypothetical protein
MRLVGDVTFYSRMMMVWQAGHLDTAITTQHIAPIVCCYMMWLDIGSFDMIDTNHHGVLTKEEVRDCTMQA